MAKHLENIVLTNMCMIYDKTNEQVLVQHRVKSWCGVAFPGGKVEKGEPIVDSVKREVKEETGLDIDELELIIVRNWYDVAINERVIVFCYRTSCFKGEILPEDKQVEGKIYWVKLEDLMKEPFAPGFEEQVSYFFDSQQREIFWRLENNKWIKKIS